MQANNISHAGETHTNPAGRKLNWLRASVLGANDGVVSIAALVVGVAGASDSLSFILAAGIAGILAGALSMAVGEYVSVSTQRDTERALIASERGELENQPDEEFSELVSLYEGKGLSNETATTVAHELTAHDVFAAHADAELHIDPHNLTNPWQAAIASATSFSIGAIIPLIAIILPPASLRISVTFVAVFVALIITGSLSAYVGGSSKTRATVRVVIGGIVAMIITFGVGKLFGTTVI